MPRYYFEIIERDVVLDDPDGAEADSIGDAKKEAAKAIREIAAEHLKIERKLDLTCVRIRDEKGSVEAVVTYEEAMDDILP
jgi:hypothetical protein